MEVLLASLGIVAAFFVRKEQRRRMRRPKKLDWNFVAHSALANGAEALLEKACEHFAMETVFVREASGNIIWEIQSGDAAFSVDDDYIFAYAQKKETILEITYLGLSLWRNHPMYTQAELERYIAVPMLINGVSQGFLCFMSKFPAHMPLTKNDKDILLSLAEWVARERYSRVDEPSSANEARAIA